MQPMIQAPKFEVDLVWRIMLKDLGITENEVLDVNPTFVQIEVI